MAHKNRVSIDPVTVKAFGAVLDAYSTFATNTTTDNVGSVVLFQNLTDISIMLSDDGVDDKFPLASDSYLLLDMNKYVKDRQMAFAAGMTWQAKRLNAGTAATVGAVYITVFHPAV